MAESRGSAALIIADLGVNFASLMRKPCALSHFKASVGRHTVLVPPKKNRGFWVSTGFFLILRACLRFSPVSALAGSVLELS